MTVPLFQPGDLVTWREAFTGRECRGVVRESREMREATGEEVHWYMVASVNDNGEPGPARPLAERRLKSAGERYPVASVPTPTPQPAQNRKAKFKLGELVTWIEGRSARERRGRIEAISHEGGFGHSYLVRSVAADGQLGKQARQFAEVELQAPREPEADLLPPDELARRMADLRERLKS
ncbi:hypothetical protein EHF33_20455 (plasmid) [Deinococcus psychrotolerans]|uniref:Uncharacterized protein n=1 Tax=Deinococcus psychrotolerans TaxID=2489213 RepID=A0A3G8YRW8_9DEIO|nr:hypothetical protein [Deinococcus psychrotolerans]AZI45284.1 hypothetical protein EHF33_20455 [Deinococcus psychrotolerans]